MHPPFKNTETKGATATSTLVYLEVETNKLLKDKSEVYIRYISTGYHE